MNGLIHQSQSEKVEYIQPLPQVERSVPSVYSMEIGNLSIRYAPGHREFKDDKKQGIQNLHCLPSEITLMAIKNALPCQ